MARVAVFGLGYVGCVSAACLSRDGHSVIGVDVDPKKVNAINSGCSPVVEPGLDTLVSEQVRKGMLRATRDLATPIRESDVALITVGTPSNRDGSASTAAVERVVQDIGRSLAEDPRDYAIVVRSTLLPGILEGRLQPILDELLPGDAVGSVELCNNPEFLRETTAIGDYDNPPFILIGANSPAARDAVLGLYDRVAAERIVTDTRTSAMVKYACNAFHAVKIDFANEIGTVAGSLGADARQVMDIVCRDRRLNISPAYLRPGFAFGGSCLPKDVRALVRTGQQQAIDLPLLSSVLPSNAAHMRRALDLVRASEARRVGLLGLSFKAGTDDLRESPLVFLAETLLGTGYDLRIHDPFVQQSRLTGSNLAFVDLHLPHLAKLLVSDVEELVSHSDLVLVGTDVADGVLAQVESSVPVLDLRRDVFDGGRAGIGAADPR